MAESSIQGKVALVTGSTKGIGLAIAEALLNEGAKVVISARSTAEVAAVHVLDIVVGGRGNRNRLVALNEPAVGMLSGFERKVMRVTGSLRDNGAGGSSKLEL